MKTTTARGRLRRVLYGGTYLDENQVKELIETQQEMGGSLYESLRKQENLSPVDRVAFLCDIFAHLVYLEAVKAAVDAGVGSRGSAFVLAEGGTRAHADLGDEWRFAPEDVSFKERVLETEAAPDGTVASRWVDRRPVPESDAWFETAWAEFREGKIYK